MEKLRPAGRFFRNRILPSTLPVGKYRKAISQSSNSLRSRVLETLESGRCNFKLLLDSETLRGSQSEI